MNAYLFVVLILSSANPLSLDRSTLVAQSNPVVVGSVKDVNGEPVKDASVLAENPSAVPSTFAATTDDKGQYSLAGIKPGVWRLTVSARGFASASRDIAIGSSGSALSPLDFRLTPRTAPPAGRGIETLTADSLKEALNVSSEDAVRFSSPLLVKLAAAADDPAQLTTVLALAKDAPFNIQILTPFSRAALAAGEARRKFTSPPALSVDTLNKEGLTVEVSAGNSFVTADAIEGVVIKRGDQIIKPVTSDVKPVTIENRMGAKRESAVGRFRFPIGAFAATGPLTIVLVGKVRNFEIPMSEAELSLLR